MKEEPGSYRILIADDNQDALFALRTLLEEQGYAVTTAGNGKEALQKIEAEIPDLALLDVVMPEMDGYQVTAEVKSDSLLRYVPIVLLTAQSSLEDIVHGLDQGADSYILKPYKKEELLARVNALLRLSRLYKELKRSEEQNRELVVQVKERYQFSNIIGKSSSMRAVYDLVEKVANSTAPILITGPTGTGKELVAKAIHFNSPRKTKRFIVQNCSAFAENLLESELFGYVRGAFTGADRDKEGLFEAADGGTFFLDELGEMSAALQVKLLRVLQDGTFTPVGSTKEKKVNVRIVAATNRDLKRMVQDESFREDLFYRISVVNIKLPPLRERRVDIPLLIKHFMEAEVVKGAVPKELSESALEACVNYAWPGNVRELQNEIERAVLLSGSDTVIEKSILSPHITDDPSAESRGKRLVGKLRDAIEGLERDMILSALERTEWNKSEAARELGISRSSLISKVQSYGLEQ